MKILITGGKGYIARSIYDALKDKYEITTISRDDFDLTNTLDTNKFFKDKHFDVVIHCAVIGGSRLKKDTWDVTDKNLIMYYNLLTNQSHYDKFIHFGSGAEIYANDQPYGFSKDVIRKSMMDKPNFYNLRIYAVFDENELDTRFIKSNILKYLRKEPMSVIQDKKMCFFYMKDLIDLVDKFIQFDQYYSAYSEFECVYHYHYKLSEILDLINNLDDYKVPILIGNENGNDYINKNGYMGLGSVVGLKQGINIVASKLRAHEYQN
jgi:nucleoside-diphosphate-sugar epimerase